jgi:hypothetical protein
MRYMGNKVGVVGTLGKHDVTLDHARFTVNLGDGFTLGEPSVEKLTVAVKDHFKKAAAMALREGQSFLMWRGKQVSKVVYRGVHAGSGRLKLTLEDGKKVTEMHVTAIAPSKQEEFKAIAARIAAAAEVLSKVEEEFKELKAEHAASLRGSYYRPDLQRMEKMQREHLEQLDGLS